MEYYAINTSPSLSHFGILGMKWGIRRYQNPDGSLTEAGRWRYTRQNGSNGELKSLEKWQKSYGSRNSDIFLNDKKIGKTSYIDESRIEELLKATFLSGINLKKKYTTPENIDKILDMMEKDSAKRGKEIFVIGAEGDQINYSYKLTKQLLKQLKNRGYYPTQDINGYYNRTRTSYIKYLNDKNLSSKERKKKWKQYENAEDYDWE